ncbi:unnamed protein product [Ixodes persulcatus]
MERPLLFFFLTLIPEMKTHSLLVVLSESLPCEFRTLSLSSASKRARSASRRRICLQRTISYVCMAS